jgi:hypothetical protein
MGDMERQWNKATAKKRAAWRKLILEMMEPETRYTYEELIRTIFGRQMADAVNGKTLEVPTPLWSRAIEELEVLGLIKSFESGSQPGSFYQIAKNPKQFKIGEKRAKTI